MRHIILHHTMLRLIGLLCSQRYASCPCLLWVLCKFLALYNLYTPPSSFNYKFQWICFFIIYAFVSMALKLMFNCARSALFNPLTRRLSHLFFPRKSFNASYWIHDWLYCKMFGIVLYRFKFPTNSYYMIQYWHLVYCKTWPTSRGNAGCGL